MDAIAHLFLEDNFLYKVHVTYITLSSLKYFSCSCHTFIPARIQIIKSLLFYEINLLMGMGLLFY